MSHELFSHPDTARPVQLPSELARQVNRSPFVVFTDDTPSEATTLTTVSAAR